MDADRFDPVPDEQPAPDAEDDRTAAEAPDADDSPAEDEGRDDGDGEDDGADPDEQPEDPQEELTRLRRERAESERADRERAERESQEQARRQREAQQHAEAQRTYARTQAWQSYQAAKARIAQQRLDDFETARQSEDPNTVYRFLNEQRNREEQTEDWRYNQWAAQDRQAELAQTQQALAAASTRQYADYVREAYGLPHDTLQEILSYSDGNPVHFDHFASRAAEIVDRRKADAKRTREIRRLQREQDRDDVRGRTGYAPGSGRGRSAVGKELEGTIEELREYFPLGRDRLRQRRTG